MASNFQVDIAPELIARARDGDVAAFERIYRELRVPVYTLARRLCRCAADADDVLQETFIEAFRKLCQFRGEAPFWAWLRRITVNTALMRLRQGARWELGLEGVPDEAEASVERRVMDCQALEDALSRLPDVARAVVWLYDVEGYTHAEIARLMGKTPSFSKSQLSRAHARLREWLQWETQTPQFTPLLKSC